MNTRHVSSEDLVLNTECRLYGPGGLPARAVARLAAQPDWSYACNKKSVPCRRIHVKSLHATTLGLVVRPSFLVDRNTLRVGVAPGVDQDASIILSSFGYSHSAFISASLVSE